jgi:hypothetical protein
MTIRCEFPECKAVARYPTEEWGLVTEGDWPGHAAGYYCPTHTGVFSEYLDTCRKEQRPHPKPAPLQNSTGVDNCNNVIPFRPRGS